MEQGPNVYQEWKKTETECKFPFLAKVKMGKKAKQNKIKHGTIVYKSKQQEPGSKALK